MFLVLFWGNMYIACRPRQGPPVADVVKDKAPARLISDEGDPGNITVRVKERILRICGMKTLSVEFNLIYH